jgi:hypothetical protein
MSDPGWYPDPIGAAWARFWTGSEWSSRVTDFDGNEGRLGSGLETVPPPWGGSRWEYKVLNTGELQSEEVLESRLVELGNDGWDLTQFVDKIAPGDSVSQRVLIFKRKQPAA